MSFLRSRFFHAVLILGIAFFVFRFGIRPPAPWSVIRLYMTVVLLATLIYVSADSDSWRNFVRPIRSTLMDPGRRTLRYALMVVIPLLLGLMPLKSGIAVMSTRADGKGMPLPVTQSFKMPPTMSLPPARTFPAVPSWSSSPTACETVVGSCKSKPFIAHPLQDDFLRAARTRALVSGMSSTHTPTAL